MPQDAPGRGRADKAAHTVTFLLQEEAAQVKIRASGVNAEKAAKYISTYLHAK